MNIVELSEKNMNEAVKVYKRVQLPLYEQLVKQLPEDNVIKKDFYGSEGDGITYLFTEKGNCNGLVTIDKPTAEIKNLSLDFDNLSQSDLNKILEFTLKQFSAISLVFLWVNSLDNSVMDLIEQYGFEYTGQQDYLNKDKFISNYKYVFRRKK